MRLVELTNKELKAVNNYMRGMNKGKALKKAGFGDSEVNSPNMVFSRPHVIEEIERRQQRLIKDNELTEKWIVDRLMTIADANFGDLIEYDDSGAPFINYSKMDRKMRVALAGMDIEQSTSGRGSAAKPVTKIKIRPADKLRALEMLMKYLGLGKDRMEISMDQELVNRLYRGRERANNALQQTPTDTEE